MESAVVVKDHLAPIIGCLRESKERVGPPHQIISLRISLREGTSRYPKRLMVGVAGFEPATPSSRTRCSAMRPGQAGNYKAISMTYVFAVLFRPARQQHQLFSARNDPTPIRAVRRMSA